MNSSVDALKLAWSWIKGNWQLNIVAFLIFLGLEVLSLIPIAGYLFGFAILLATISTQAYIAKKALSGALADEKATEEEAKKTTLNEYLGNNLVIAAGAALGYAILYVAVMVIVWGVFTAMLNSWTYYFDPMKVLTPVILIGTIVGSMVLYVVPAVMGEIVVSETFAEAFKKVFYLFNPKVWKSCLNKEYFAFVVVWMLIVAGLVAASLLSIMSLVLIPVGIFLLYFLDVYSAFIYAYANKIRGIQGTVVAENIEESAKEDGKSLKEK